MLLLAPLKGWRRRKEFGKVGGGEKLDFKFLFLICLPHFLSSSKWAWTWPRNSSLKYHPVFGKIYNESHLLPKHMGSGGWVFHRQVPASVARLTQVCGWCWVTLAGRSRPVLCLAESLGGVGSSSSKLSCSQSITIVEWLYSDYRCSTSLQKPLNKIKCLPYKKLWQGMQNQICLGTVTPNPSVL